MTGYGTHYQSPGMWSDDTSLTLCLAQSLVEAGYDLADAGKRFVRWYREGYWTPYGRAFDIDGATRRAILRLESGVDPVLAGPEDEMSNGNGLLIFTSSPTPNRTGLRNGLKRGIASQAGIYLPAEKVF
jgi:ADP-ribosylglycohydrolase